MQSRQTLPLSPLRFILLVMRCMNDADSGTAARVWRSPLSSTTPSTGIPARRPRRRRARSCLSLTPFSRDPRDRSTLRTLPGRESTYEHTLVVSWCLILPLQIIIRLPSPVPSLLFCVPKLLLLFVFALTNGVLIETKRSRDLTWITRSYAAVCRRVLAFSLDAARRIRLTST